MAGLQARLRRRLGGGALQRTAGAALLLLLFAAALRPAGATAFACTRSGAICNALGDLYASTNGAGWELPNVAGVGVPPQAWAASASGIATDYCTFEGVVCDSANNVVSLCVRAAAQQHARRWACGGE